MTPLSYHVFGEKAYWELAAAAARDYIRLPLLRQSDTTPLPVNQCRMRLHNTTVSGGQSFASDVAIVLIAISSSSSSSDGVVGRLVGWLVVL